MAITEAAALLTVENKEKSNLAALSSLKKEMVGGGTQDNIPAKRIGELVRTLGINKIPIGKTGRQMLMWVW